MPRTRPPTSGYARIAQADEEEEEEEETTFDGSEEEREYHRGVLSSPESRYAPIQPKRRERMTAFGSLSTNSRRPLHTRRRTNSGVDIKAINARLERWADEIAQKFKIRKVRGKTTEEEHLEIHHSVFIAPDWIRPATAEILASHDDEVDPEKLTKSDFDDITESIRVAIELGIHPKLVAQGSSGSYFAKNTQGKTVGIFKPKDEEPYANKNPKWTKWIHRNLFPFFFGRACLIPNLSYISEAAAYVLDCRLRTNLVPYTDVVSFSSKSFFYDFWDRRAYYRKKKPFPEKPGSLQIFLKGFKDANLFLKEHPWPDQVNSGFRTDAAPRKRRRWAEDCRPRGAPSDDEEEDLETEPPAGRSARSRSRRREYWSPQLQQSFREQLEKLVILDYIMRNTDRGLDNWMIRIDEENEEASIIVDPPKHDQVENGQTNGYSDPYKRNEPMTTSTLKGSGGRYKANIGAIDNSLSWPWKHPDAWRSFPFGWLFLPVSLIGRPFSEATKLHFLPLLTSKQWWSETQAALRKCFEMDSDFQEKMFARQIAVMKGQAWNVVETLKTPDHGPLELTRRERVCVWDDIVEIPVALPLRVPSTEVRRKQAQQPKARNIAEEEEMDISAAYASAPTQQHDLLGLNDNNVGTAQNNRFNMSRQHSGNDVRASEDSNAPLSPASLQGFTFDTSKESGLNARPIAPRSKTRLSLDEPRKLFDNLGERRRRFSLGLSRQVNGFSSIDSDDMDGDLGYAAAEDQEGNRRKVIVERLETVKSRNPVFTWC